MAEIGSVIDGKYEILTEIGHGGMSVVYLAMDTHLNKQWAVKEIKKKGSGKNDEIVVNSLLAEANMMKRLDHPSLPRIVDIIDNGITIYVVMDYIEGESLDKILAEYGAQPEELVIGWAKQLCDALSYLHSQKPPIIYRDMKPANVMLKPEGNIKIIDFGIAREYKEQSLADTTVLGTKGYAPPEQYSGQTDARSDIYALGMTMHHLLTGIDPRTGEAYAPVRMWNPEVSEGMEMIIDKCVQPAAEHRYQNCQDLLYDLEHPELITRDYKRKQKRKLNCFITSVTLAVVMVISGVVCNIVSTRMNNSDWDTTIPTITNAGSYIVWVKATKQYYDDKNVDVIKAENAVAPYNVYMAKASQVISFDKYTGEETSVEITQAEMEAGKEFVFTATDKEKKAGGTITYSVAFDEGDDEIATIDSQTGVLVVKGAGKITIKAILSGNDNYNECTIEHALYVKGKSAAGEWISFPENTIEYILGNAKGITENAAVKKEDKDKGAISYSIENGSDLGLRIDSKSGVISIADYSKVMKAIEAGNGILNVTVKADKTEYSKRGWWNKANYPADSTSYTLKISMSDAPTSAYKIYAADDLETELIKPNGENDWYNTTLIIKPADGYSIIRADELTKDKPSFKDSVKFGEMVETEAKDQGASLSHYIYLEETATGNITKKIEISNLKLDTIAPYNVNIDFPDVEEKDSVKYYGDYITVTFTAYDVTSGVDHFDWKYTRENGASNSNLESDNGTVSAQLDKDDPNKYSATLTLPRNKAEQLRGNLQVTAIDKAGNNSVSYTDEGVFVIDTIAPTQKVEYKLKNNDGSNQIVGEKHYFSNDVEFTFKIVEANFYSEDVTITVSKNNGSAEKQSVTWTDTENSDEHQVPDILDQSYIYDNFAVNVQNQIAVSLNYQQVEPVYFDITSMPQLALVGKLTTNMIGFEKALINEIKMSYFDRPADVYIIDSLSRDLMGYAEEPFVEGYEFCPERKMQCY